MVHAGSNGEQGAVVCALEFSPMQLRIADDVASDIKSQSHAGPRSAQIKDGELQIKYWTTG
jgi:septum site-determining protein MinC